MIKLSSPETEEFWEISVLFEDEHLLVLNKPARLGLVSDPAEPARASLMDLLHKGIADGKPWATQRSLSFLMNAHRLETETSGVLLLAKNKTILSDLLNRFGSEQTELAFLTIVAGNPSENRFSVNAKLAPDPTRPGVVRVDQRNGKQARTTFDVLERFTRWTLLKATLLTHRPHQVRAHLVRAGFRMAGDAAYGGKPLLLSSMKPGYRLKPKQVERPLLGEPCLHAAHLSFVHPVTGASLAIEAPTPKALQVALKYLRKYAFT